MLESKGKDKGRQKFNHITNEQLRALKYKSKIGSVSNSSPSPNKKESRIVDDEEEE